jgi:thymidylate kinase
MENSALPGGNMLILLEGVDGSGKTTLCNQLKEKGIPVVPSVGRLCKYPYYEWMKLGAENLVSIVDRSFITELVYRIVDGKNVGTMRLDDMCKILSFCKIVLCETDTSFEDSMTRGEDNITNKEQAEQIKYVYSIITEMFCKFLKVPVYKYSWKNQSVEDVINFIKEVK